MGVQADFDLQFNISQNELSQRGYCRTILAQNYVPGAFHGSDLYKADPEGFSTKKYWHEPLTGILLLQPNFLNEQFWNTTTYETAKLTAAEWTFGSGDFETLYLQNISATPCSPVVVTHHTNTSGAIDPLTGLTAVEIHNSTGTPASSLLAGNSNADYAYLLQTDEELARNEGFAFQLLTHDLAQGSIFPYLCVYFGGDYCLLMGSGGRAELWKNEPITDSDTQDETTWRRVQVMDYSSSVDPENNGAISVMVVPFSRKYIGFYIGPGLVTSTWAGSNGSEDTSPARRYLYEVKPIAEYDTGTGTTEDDDDGLFRITPKGKVTIAAPLLSQFALGFYRLRYPSTEQTVYLAPENLGEIFDAKPSWESVGTNNRGLVTYDTVNVDSTAWDETTDTESVAKIVSTAGQGLPSETASGEYCYSPEMYYATATIDSNVAETVRTPVDISNLFQQCSLTQRINEPSYMDVWTAPDESLNPYQRSHSMPIRLKMTDPATVANDTWTLFEGYVTDNAADVGPIGPALSFQCVDGWQILDECLIWDSPVHDGKGIVESIQYYLNYAGYDNSRIYVTDLVLSTYLPEAERPQDYTFRARPGDTAGDCIRRLLDAGLDVRLRQGWGTDGLTALDGATSLSTEDWVWIIEHRPVYTTSTPISGRFWIRRPAGVSWEHDAHADRFKTEGTTTNLKVFSATINTKGPRYNKLLLDCPTGSGKDAERISIKTLTNVDSIETSAHRDYTGRVKVGYIPASTHGARSINDLTLVARRIEEDEMHTAEYATISGEWRPWILPDSFVELYDYSHTTGFVVKLGVYRVLEASPSFRYDRDTAQVALIECLYTLMWEHEGDAYTDPNEEE